MNSDDKIKKLLKTLYHKHMGDKHKSHDRESKYGFKKDKLAWSKSVPNEVENGNKTSSIDDSHNNSIEQNNIANDLSSSVNDTISNKTDFRDSDNIVDNALLSADATSVIPVNITNQSNIINNTYELNLENCIETSSISNCIEEKGPLIVDNSSKENSNLLGNESRSFELNFCLHVKDNPNESEDILQSNDKTVSNDKDEQNNSHSEKCSSTKRGGKRKLSKVAYEENNSDMISKKSKIDLSGKDCSRNVSDNQEQTEMASSKIDDISDKSDDEELFCVKNLHGKDSKMFVSAEVIEEMKSLTNAVKPPTAFQLKVFSVNALEFMLKYNGRPSYNLPKNDLVKMIAEYMKDGCPPRCPKCEKGALKFSNGKKKTGKRYFWCPGFSPNGKNFYGCGFKARKGELENIPWKCPS